MKRLGGSLALAALLGFAGAPAQAVVVVENIDQTGLPVTDVYVAGTFSERVANAFTTGTGSSHYTLNSIQIKIQSTHGTLGTGFKVWLARASGANPGTNIKQLSGNTSPLTGKHTYTCSSTTNECRLSPNTTYFVVLEDPSTPTTAGYQIRPINATTETGDGTQYGWSIADRLRQKKGVNNWTAYTSNYPLPLSINATALVAPVASKASVTVAEGGTANYTVRMAAQPAHPVTLTVSTSGDSDVTASPKTLIFTKSDWNTAQSVTVSAAQDNDGTNGNATVTYTADSIVPLYRGRKVAVTVTETDDDLVVLSRMTLAVPESGSANYTIKLAKAPTATVTVAVARQAGGDSNLSATPSSLNFTQQNWSTAQTVTVAATADTDALDGTATFSHTATSTDTSFSNVTIASLAATEADSGKTPTLGASDLTPVSATLSIVSHGGAWYYKRTSPTPAGACSSAVDGTKAALTGLNPGAYTYKAYSDSGCATELASLTFTAPPRAPTGFEAFLAGEKNCASAGGDRNTTKMTWDNPNESSITRYEYQQRFLNSSGGVVADWGTATAIASSGASTTSALIDCVSHSLRMEYRIRAVNATPTPAAASEWSASQRVDSTSFFYPGPRLVSAVAAGVSSATLTWEWKDSDGNAPTIPGNVTIGWQYVQDGTTDFHDICDNCPNTRTHTVTSLTPGQTYTFEVWANAAISEDTAVNGSNVLAVTLPTMTIAPASRQLAVTEGSTAHYTVKLAAQPTNAATVSVSKAAGSDASLTISPSALTFTTQNWNTAQSVTVTAAEDSDGLRGTATFTHELTDGQVKGSKDADYITVTETENDQALTFSPTALDVPEGSTANYTVVLAAEPTDSVTVSVTAKASPAPDTDLTLDTDGSTSGNQNTLTFTTTNWSTAQSVTVAAAEDNDGSNGATTYVHTPNSGSYTSTHAGELVATETDNDQSVTLSLSTARIWEDAGATTVTVTATLTSAETTATTVTLSVDSSSTATSGTDYTALATLPNITIAANQTSATATVTVTPTDDSTLEGVETIVLAGTATGNISVTSTTLSLEDDDTTLSLTLDTTSALENAGATTVTVTATLDRALSAAATVTLATSGTATATTDYTLAPSTLPKITLAAAATSGTATVTLTPVDDALSEAHETVVFTGSTDGLDSGAATFTITDNENPTVALSLSTTSAAENASAASTVTVTATLNRAATAATTVTLAVDSASTATGAGTDYTLAPATLPKITVAANATTGTAAVTITMADDTLLEGNETVVLAGSETNLTTGAKGTFTILDDEIGVDLSLSPATAAEDAGATTVTVTATLGTAQSTATTVTLAVDSTSTASSADYTLTPSDLPKITVAANATTGTATVTLTPTDPSPDDPEPDETVVFAASGTKLVAGTKGTFTITDDEVGIGLSLSTSTVAENASAATVTVTATLTSAPTTATTVTLAVDSSSTASSSDYALTPSALPKITVAANGTSGTATVTLAPTDDSESEADETVVLAGTGTGLISDTATFTITDDENPSIALSLSATSATEGASPAATTVTVTATLNRPATSATTVTLAVDSTSTATGSGTDYTLAPSTLPKITVAAQGTTGTAAVTLTVVDDTAAESSETVVLKGSGTSLVAGTATFTLYDNDLVTLSKSAVSVTEGSTNDYTVVLRTAPTAAVTVTPSIASTPTPDSDLTVSTANSNNNLTFTTQNWSTAQSVTVSAAEDDDGENGTATVAHAASSSDSRYNGSNVAIGTVAATENDNDTKAFTVNPAISIVSEGGTTNYTLFLATQPTGSVTVTVSRQAGGDASLTASTSNSDNNLTFTTGNWNLTQSVTLSAAEDDDGENGQATFTHTASGGGYGSVTGGNVTAIEEENDTKGFTFDPTSVTVTEGSTETYTVVLDTEPTAAVTVTAAAKTTPTPDDDLTVSTSNTDDKLTFTTSNWSTAQTVTVSAAQDVDGLPGSTVFKHTASGGGYGSITGDVTATEVDDDKNLMLSPTSLTAVSEGGTANYTVKLTSLPTASVTVSITRHSGDASLTASPGSLTFTTQNWSTAQSVTVSAAQDLDGEDGEATFRHAASGGGYNGISADLTATEDDDDTKAFTVSLTAATVAEGSTAKYTLKLATQPTAGVTVTVSRQAGGDASLTASTSNSDDKLTFTTGNWNTAQTVTLSAAEDDDGENGTATFAHTATGGGYGSVTGGSVAATESENDTKGFTFNPTSVTVTEGSTETYTVVLDTKPTAAVTVTPAAKTTPTPDTDLTASTSNTDNKLTFTTSNWSTAQTVTISAAQDNDSLQGSTVFKHTASGGGYNSIAGDVTATENDDDKSLTLNPTSLTAVPEGGNAKYTVKLTTLPTANVTVSVARHSGDANLTASPGSLTFTAQNWSTAQSVTVSAAQDLDGEDGTATFRQTANGGGYASVSADLTATEQDDDTKAFTVSRTAATVPEGGTADYTLKLATQPTGSVTVTVSKATSPTPDTDLTASTSNSDNNLTFTTSTWNTAQTVTLSAAEDDDGENGTATFTHTATGGGYGSVTGGNVAATEGDNDTKGFTFNPAAVTVAEGGTANYTVVLDTKPTAAVTVTVSRASGDADLTASTSNSDNKLTFTTSNWNTAQSATLAAAQDDDAVDGTATFAHTASGGGYGAVTGNVRATEQDDEYQVSLSMNPAMAEEDAGAVTVVVTARLDRAAAAAVTVTLSVDAAGTAADADYALAPATLPKITVLANAASNTATVTLTPVDDDETELDETVVLTSSGTGLAAAADAVFTIVDNDGNAAVLEQALAGLGRGMLNSASAVLGARMSAEPGSGGLPSLAGLDPDDPGSSLAEQFYSGGFDLRLNADDAVAERWSLWGKGDYQDFEKDSGSVQYDGDLKTAYVGVDLHRADRVMGVALSRSKGKAAYKAKQEGRLETQLTALHPYFRTTLDSGAEAWVGTGVGWGDAEEWREGRPSSEKSDLEMWMASAGMRWPLESKREGLELALRGEASYMHLETDSGERPIDGLTAEAHQVRAGLEFSWPQELEGGILSKPFGALVGRYDGGDDVDGVGLEMQGGWCYTDPVRGTELEMRGRWLVAHAESGYDEFGVSATAQFEPAADGRGLHLLLSPRWGALREGESALWGQEALPSARQPEQPGWMLHAEAGYGQWSSALGGVATWFGELEHGVGQQRLRLGTRLASERAATEALSLEIFSEWRKDSEDRESLIGIDFQCEF